MAALPADIIRATRRARIVTREDVQIRELFPSAQDQIRAPEPGFFENAEDAETVLGIKAELTGSFRRLFAVSAHGVVEVDPESCVPTFHLTDGELGFDGPVMVTRWQLDLNSERAEIEVIG
ncbi:MAG: hypothetical protein AAFY42_13595 [Pseudomonadota bacterium]